MENDPELNGKYLGTITKDFVKVSTQLKEASYQLIKRKISQYPIFPVCKDQLKFGQILFSKNEFEIDWNVHFSMLEEFLQLGLVDEEKAEVFMNTYKDPEEFCCLFVVDVEFMKFIFLPYPEDED